MKQFIFITILAFTLSSCNNYGDKISFGSNEMYYTKNVSREQAQKLGDYLVAQQFYKTDGRKASVQLDKAADTFLFRMVVLENFIANAEYAENAKTFCGELSRDVFNQQPVIIHFCDNKLKTVKAVRP